MSLYAEQKPAWFPRLGELPKKKSMTCSSVEKKEKVYT